MKLDSSEIQSVLTLERFNKFVDSNVKSLTLFAVSYVSEQNVAEDIVMEAMMSVWNSREKLNCSTSMAYALTVIKNKSFNHLRDQKTKLRVQDLIQEHEMRVLDLRISMLDDTLPEEMCRTENEHMIAKIINSFSEKTRKIFILNKYDEKSYKEIADELGITVKSVEYELLKGMNELRRRLKSIMLTLIIFLVNL